MVDLDSIQALLQQIPVFQGLESEYLEAITGCAANVRFDEGQLLFSEGDDADRFYVVRHGLVAIDMYIPQRGSVTIETLGPNEVVGWSWLLPPYRWHFDARAVESTRAVAFDARCLRGKCDADARMGYALMQRFSRIIVKRLQAARVQLMDVYGNADVR